MRVSWLGETGLTRAVCLNWASTDPSVAFKRIEKTERHHSFVVWKSPHVMDEAAEKGGS